MTDTNLKHTDLELLALLKSGDWDAFRCIYEKYWEKLYLTTYRVLQDEDSSKDVVQDLFLKIWERRAVLDIVSLEAYLSKSVKNQVARKLHNAPVQLIHLDAFQDVLSNNPTEDEILQKDLQLRVLDSLAHLPERCRAVFYLSRFEQKTNKEIAAQLDISVSTVENQINKALKFLRAQVPYLFSLIVFFYD
ncbi:MAG: RNA polymerase sigma-70 factor [Bacteroidota bacterium]